MKPMQYTIMRLDNGLRAQWDGKTILFDTQEEAEEMITSFPEFFLGPKELKIKSGIYFIDKSINYKDLKKKEDFIKEMNSQIESRNPDDETIRCFKKVL